jgi:hypothetical protein
LHRGPAGAAVGDGDPDLARITGDLHFKGAVGVAYGVGGKLRDKQLDQLK